MAKDLCQAYQPRCVPGSPSSFPALQLSVPSPPPKPSHVMHKLFFCLMSACNTMTTAQHPSSRDSFVSHYSLVCFEIPTGFVWVSANTLSPGFLSFSPSYFYCFERGLCTPGTWHTLKKKASFCSGSSEEPLHAGKAFT